MTALVSSFGYMSTNFAATADPLHALALAARDGESVAFTRLYEHTKEQAWSVLFRVVGASPDLEDLLQESYLQLMRALKTYRGDSTVRTFVHRVCVNVGLMYLRKKRRRKEDVSAHEQLPELEAHELHNPERAAHVTQAAQAARHALGRMSDEKAAVFVYHDILDLKPEEISALMRCPPNTVRSRLNRAREDFTKLIAPLKRGEG